MSETKNVKAQIQVAVNTQVGKGSKSLAKQISSDLASALGPAVEKAFTNAFTKAFNKAQPQLEAAAKKTAEAQAQHQAKVEDQISSRKKRKETAATRSSYADELQAGIRAEAEKRFGPGVSAAGRAMIQLQPKDVAQSVYIKAQAQVATAKAENQARIDRERVAIKAAAKSERKTQVEEKAAWDRSSRVAKNVQSRHDELVKEGTKLSAEKQRQTSSTFEARAAELQQREAAAAKGMQSYATAAQRARQIHETRVRQRTAFEIALGDDSGTTARREAITGRQIASVERQIGSLGGSDEPRIAQYNALQPGLGTRWGRARRLGALFPGAAGIARATGLPIGLVRGGMMGGAMFGGMASGSPLMGLAGGMGAGAQGAGLLGLGGLGSGLLAGGLGAVGLAGAAGVYGAVRGYGQAPAALGFYQAMQGQMQAAPTQVGNVDVLRNRAHATALAASRYGLGPSQAAQIMGDVYQTAGGWAGSNEMFAMQRSGLAAQAGLGVSATTHGRLEYARRRGGMTAPGRFPAGSLSERLGAQAIGMGFGGAEIEGVQSQVAGLLEAARAQGTMMDPTRFMQSAADIGGSVGPAAGMRIAGGLQGAVQNLATGGLGASGNPQMDLLMMQAFGGLKIGRGQRVGARELWGAQRRMEKGVDLQGGLQQLFGSAAGAARGSSDLRFMLAQRMLGSMGVSVGPAQLEALMSGKPGADIQALLEKGGAAEQGAFAARGGAMGRGAALVAEPVRRAAQLEADIVKTGEAWLKASQDVNNALQAFTEKLTGAAPVLERIAGMVVE